MMLGCSRNVEYVVWKDVPNDPSITVIPETISDIAYSRKIEKDLIRIGQRVLAAPPAKNLARTESMGETKGGLKAKIDDGEYQGKVNNDDNRNEITETYYNVAELKSTHVMYVNYRNKQLRFVENAGQQVLGIIEVTESSGLLRGEADDNRQKSIAELLRELGFAIREIKIK